MINKKNYIPTVCVVYTILVTGKLILEAFLGEKDYYYTENLLFMLVISAAATLVLMLQQYLHNVPLLFIIIGQYFLLMGFVLGSMYLMSFRSPVSPGGYLDMAISVTVPYVILAAIYYVNYFREIKRANDTLRKLNR